MSKIGNYYIELTEQANELGFDSVEEALSNGYEVVKGNLAKAKDEQAEAHKAWLKEKQIVLGDLKNLIIHSVYDFDIIKHAIDFIEAGEQ